MTDQSTLPSLAIELEIPFADVDSQQIVWHGNYLRYFELARVRMFEKCDLFSLIEEGKVNFVVSESYCKHYHPLRFRDRCRVSTTFLDIDHRLNMRFFIHKSDGTKIAKGHTHLVSLNGDGKLQLVTPQAVSERIYAAADASSVETSSTDSSSTGTSSARREFIFATTALLALLLRAEPVLASDLPPQLEALLAQHHKAPGLYAKFVEEKHIAFLKVPLKNEGYLAYLPPNQFARIVEKPSPSKIVANGKSLSFREGTGPKTELSLVNRPELRALVEGIIYLLSGDSERISQLYNLGMTDCKKECRLELIPKDEKMRSLVTKFVIQATATQLKSFEVHEKSGDYSVTYLHELDLKRQFSEAEKQSLFSI